MPTYALLGATGSTGSAILRCLLSQPPQDLTLNIFVRSRSKLIQKFPDVESTTTLKGNIIEGDSSDSVATQQCLKDVDVVLACIGSNYSSPDISLIYDTATAIIAALDTHRTAQGPAYRPPTVIQLRSASLNPVLKAAMPYMAQIGAPFCFHYIYADLDRACTLFASRASSTDPPKLLDYIFIDPPAIHDADGTTPTGHRLILDEKQHPTISYADLGAAFCEAAERRREFAGKAVGVTATGVVNETWGQLIPYMLAGAKSRIWG